MFGTSTSLSYTKFALNRVLIFLSNWVYYLDTLYQEIIRVVPGKYQKKTFYEFKQELVYEIK